MGFFKDLNELKKTGDAMRPPEHSGMMGGFRAMRDGVATANQMVGGLAAEQQKTAMLMASGVVGQARIDQISDTGTTINDNPQVQFALTVTIPGREPYSASLTQVVSRIAIGSFQPGATVPVRVSPEDPQILMIA
jgi:hypothetical protein